MSRAAGFKRTNIQGYTVIADPALVRLLRRESSDFIGRVFRSASEHGQFQVALDGSTLHIHLHPDHTFTITTAESNQQLWA